MHFSVPVIVRIFWDPQMVPKMVFGVIYPRSTIVSAVPCGSRNLACSSYSKLRYLRSSSAFPAIRRFVVDNKTAANTTTTIITGAGSTAANGETISKQARAATDARADFDMWKLFGIFVFGWRSLFSLFL